MRMAQTKAMAMVFIVAADDVGSGEGGDGENEMEE